MALNTQLLATIIAVVKKEVGVLDRSVEKRLTEIVQKMDEDVGHPSFTVQNGCLVCQHTSGVIENYGRIVGPQGLQGVPGRDGANGADGRDGIDGKDGKDGRDGAAAAAGRDGKDGKDGLTGPQGPRGEAGPAGQQGEAGKDGKDAERGLQGLPGVDGLDGEDGVGVEKAWVDEDYHLTIRLTSGKVIDAGYVRGPAGASSGKGGRVTGGYTGGGSGSNFYVTGSRYDENGDLIITMSNGQTVRADLPTGQGVVYIQDTTPTSNNPYLWIQTNVNTDGDFSFWFKC